METYEDNTDERLNNSDESEGIILAQSTPNTFHFLQKAKAHDIDTNKDNMNGNGANSHSRKDTTLDAIEDENDNYEENSSSMHTYQDKSDRSENVDVHKSRKPNRVIRLSSKLDSKENISDENIDFTSLSNEDSKKLFDDVSKEKKREFEDKDGTIEVEKDVSGVKENTQKEIKREILNKVHKLISGKRRVSDVGAGTNRTNHRNMSSPDEPDLYFHGR